MLLTVLYFVVMPLARGLLALRVPFLPLYAMLAGGGAGAGQ
jgi:hypothetical protein